MTAPISGPDDDDYEELKEKIGWHASPGDVLLILAVLAVVMLCAGLA